MWPCLSGNAFSLRAVFLRLSAMLPSARINSGGRGLPLPRRPAGAGFPTVGRLVLLLMFGLGADAGFGAEPEGVAGFRRVALSVPKPGKVGFTALPASATHIDFTNLLAGSGAFTNQILLNGSGVAAGDVDGDGWCDLYFCNLAGSNALYRNLGQWRFTNITGQAGVACPAQNSTGAAFADVDGDADLDLFVASIGHGVRLFLNDGRGHFTEATAGAGLASNAGSMTVALADVDSDGDLDLYVANYRSETFQDHPGMAFRVSTSTGRPVITEIEGQPVSSPDLAKRYFVGEGNRILENGEADVLYLNDGHGKFTPVSWAGGAFADEDGRALEAPPLDWSLAAMFRDLNGDGAPDLYVCGDTYSPDRIWINDGRGRFRALPRLAMRETSYSSMGVDFADINRDGFDDFFVTDMLAREHTNRQTQIFMRRLPAAPGVLENRPDYQRNTLFLNRGDGTFAEIAQFAGLEATDWTWCPVFLDVDLDGYEDLLITSGQEWNLLHADTRVRIDTIRRQRRLSREEFYELRGLYGRFDSPNYAFRNRGDLTFADESAAWGFDSRQISQGICLADLDNDGDLDVAINCLRQPALIYRNNADAPRVAVRLRGRPGNIRGIGATIKVLGGPVPQSQQIIAGGRYASGDDTMRVFAAGSESNRLTIETVWRRGATSLITEALPNSIYEINEPASAADAREPRIPKSATPEAGPWFKDVTGQLGHAHHEEAFDDFARQPMLTKRLSQFGPGVSWFDFDGDGRDDLMVGTGRGGILGLYQNLGDGRFKQFVTAPLLGPPPDDQASILGWSSVAGGNALLILQSTYKTGGTNAVLSDQLEGPTLRLREGLPSWEASPGPAALADVDGDGDLDLFVGGRVEPGRYPAPCSSRLFTNVRGRFVFDEANSRVLRQVGLVNGAVFSDLDGDGAPDLVLACEWGPLRLFRNDHGRLQLWNPKLSFGDSRPAVNPQPSTLSQLTGWWQGVTAGDFDGDGQMDLVAANWGRNGRHQRYATPPIEVVFGDVNEDGVIEYLEGYRDPGLQKLMPWLRRERVAATLPFAQEHLQSYEQYSVAGVEDLFRDFLPRLSRLQANAFDTCIFLNRGDHFEVRALPGEAQFAPAFGVTVGDFDGDGAEDLFLNQNFFAVDTETSRYDAGRGLWLRGDGHGRFMAIAGQTSGVTIFGEGRGAALCDYDGDGRVDLVAAQNGAPTRLFHNERARPGLRIRLVGPPDNPAAIGATLRLIFGQRAGSAREIHLGSGYLSQDSAVQVLATPETPTHLRVRWPGGKESTVPFTAGTREMEVRSTGEARIIR